MTAIDHIISAATKGDDAASTDGAVFATTGEVLAAGSTEASQIGQVLEMINRARALQSQKNYREAEQLCMDACDLAASLVGKGSSIYGLCLEDLGVSRICQGKLRQADITLNESMTILVASLGAEHPDVARVFGRLHELYNS